MSYALDAVRQQFKNVVITPPQVFLLSISLKFGTKFDHGTAVTLQVSNPRSD